MTRTQILDEAKRLVCSDKNVDYGEPEANFRVIADLWTAYVKGNEVNGHFDADDVAVMLALVKVGRIVSGGYKNDSLVDLIGYAACAEELASENERSDSGVTIEEKHSGHDVSITIHAGEGIWPKADDEKCRTPVEHRHSMKRDESGQLIEENEDESETENERAARRSFPQSRVQQTDDANGLFGAPTRIMDENPIARQAAHIRERNAARQAAERTQFRTNGHDVRDGKFDDGRTYYSRHTANGRHLVGAVGGRPKLIPRKESALGKHVINGSQVEALKAAVMDTDAPKKSSTKKISVPDDSFEDLYRDLKAESESVEAEPKAEPARSKPLCSSNTTARRSPTGPKVAGIKLSEIAP
jgi:hypothetical protein